MAERDVIRRTGRPITVESLVDDLRTLGVEAGSTLLVHSSLSRLGWVCGGAVAVILALEEALGPSGTLVMPAMSGDLTDPKDWQHPPVPEAWKDTIRASMPAYDRRLTPTRGMGVIAETFRTRSGVVRSDHPHVSFSARGPQAERITANHRLDFGLGEGSPLARIYELDGHVLLLGVGHGNNTSIHLAEYRAEYPGKREVQNGAPMLVNGHRQWVSVRDIDIDEDDFPQIGEAFERDTNEVHRGSVGEGCGLLMRQRPLVDFAAENMMRHRQTTPHRPMGRNRRESETPRDQGRDDGVTIRSLRPEDRADWIRLRAALWPGHDVADLAREADEIAAHPDRTPVFVAAHADGCLCGLLEASIRGRAQGCTTDRVGYLEGWFVEPDARRRGIGRRLVDGAEAWARDQGCIEMASDTSPDYPVSPEAHAALGYREIERTIHFRKELR